ncbi:MAG TPA: ABC transporter permease [Streptosporangiaceae bacterium]|jgi:peptide/nickel transport system permease protein
MLGYVARRVGVALVVVLLVLIFLSVLVHLLPGNPVTLMLGPRADPALAADARRQMDLDSSVPAQVWHFVSGVARGDLGQDFLTKRPVAGLIGAALPHTLILAGVSLVLAVLIAIPLAVVSAARPGSALDRFLGTVSVGVISIPSYVIGMLLLLLATVWLGWLPAIGTGSLADPGDYLAHLVLPALSLALIWAGYLARLLRSSMLEVLGENHVRAARAYGVPEWRIYYQLALRNAIPGVVALIGVALGDLMGSAIFIEVIFTRNGLGTLLYNAITERDYPIVRGGVVVIAVLFVLANLIADLANRVIDPRLREEVAR